MDFKSYRKTHKTTEQSPPNQEDLRKTAEKYQGKSDSEILGEILSMARKGKADGSLSDEALQTFVDRITPMLGAEQQARLKQAIEMIKRN